MNVWVKRGAARILSECDFAFDPSYSKTTVADGVKRIDVSTRLTRAIGVPVSLYVVDDVLIDTGFSHARSAVLKALEGEEIRTIVCTHHHEDHTGNASVLSRRLGAPIFLHRPELRYSEGVDSLVMYRMALWGPPGDYEPQPMPGAVRTHSRVLEFIPTPGHCQTLGVFFDKKNSLVFVGDLYVTRGAHAVLKWENPYVTVRSLEKIAALGPRAMFNGHWLEIDDPVAALTSKAEQIKEAAAEAVRLSEEGVKPTAIARRLFVKRRYDDPVVSFLTSFQFSWTNFVRTAIERAGESGD